MFSHFEIIEYNSTKRKSNKNNKSVKKLGISKSQIFIGDNKNEYTELPIIYQLRNFPKAYPLFPINGKNNSLLNGEYHIEKMPMIIPNYKNYIIIHSRKHLYNLEHKTNDDYSTDISSNIYNIKNSDKIISNLNRNNYVSKENKNRYFVKNQLYKDKSYNIVLKKIYTKKNNSKSCRNLDTELNLKKEKHDKIVFSIFNNINYPKNNYDLEIFDFKTENSNNFTSKNNITNNNKEDKKNNINIDIMNQLKELNTKLKNRLDEFEEKQKNNQKNINYLLKKANHSNKSQENNKENNEDKSKDNLKNNIKNKKENVKIKPLGLYHRLAGGYNAQNFNVNRNMIIKDNKEN